MTLRVASCSCRQLKAETSADPIRVSVCHCLACQRRTGSVFAAQARFPRNAVTLSGTSAEYVRVGDEGTKVAFRFCPHCGATVSYTSNSVPATMQPSSWVRTGATSKWFATYPRPD
jgi:hypothetical protein